jgi:hypothetical protein
MNKALVSTELGFSFICKQLEREREREREQRYIDRSTESEVIWFLVG